MLNKKQIYWEHGTLLQPQHFQILNMQMLKAVDNSSYLPYFFGINKVNIREEALMLGSFELSELEIFLPSGEHIILNENAKLMSRKFDSIWTDYEQALTVWIGLPSFDLAGANVSEGDNLQNPNSRYIAAFESTQVADLYSNGAKSDIRFMDYNIRIIFDNEPELNTIPAIPIAKLRRNGGQISIASDYVPPCVNMFAFSKLHELFLSVRNILLSRVSQLEDYKFDVQGGGNSSAISNQNISMYMFNAMLARVCPKLEHLHELKNVHPWLVYGVLRDIVGELSMFADNMTPLGAINNKQVLPAYDHYNIAACFSAASLIISRIVDRLSVGPSFSLNLDFIDGAFYCKLPSEARLTPYRYYLLIRSSGDLEQLKEQSNLYKLAPKSLIQDLVSKSLPGIKINYIDRLPPGIMKRDDTLYFAIEQMDSLWDNIIQTGELSLFIPMAQSDISAQLVLLNA